MTCQQQSPLPTKKFKAPSVMRIMGNGFGTLKLCLLPICLTMVTEKPMSVTLKRLRHVICGQVPGFAARCHHFALCQAPLTLTRPVTAYHGWNVMSHPPYSSDLARSDPHLCVPLKKLLDSKRFAGHRREASCHLLATDTRNRFILRPDTDLGGTVGDYVEVRTNNKVLAIRDFVTPEVLCALQKRGS